MVKNAVDFIKVESDASGSWIDLFKISTTNDSIPKIKLSIFQLSEDAWINYLYTRNFPTNQPIRIGINFQGYKGGNMSKITFIYNYSYDQEFDNNGFLIQFRHEKIKFQNLFLLPSDPNLEFYQTKIWKGALLANSCSDQNCDIELWNRNDAWKSSNCLHELSKFEKLDHNDPPNYVLDNCIYQDKINKRVRKYTPLGLCYKLNDQCQSYSELNPCGGGCKDGYFEKFSTCNKCHAECFTCATQRDACTKCARVKNSPRFLLDGNCIRQEITHDQTKMKDTKCGQPTLTNPDEWWTHKYWVTYMDKGDINSGICHHCPETCFERKCK